MMDPMLSAFILTCALAPSPWSFTDPLTKFARLETIHELHVIADRYLGYEWGLVEIGTFPKDENLEPTPWVFRRWRLWAKRSA